MTLNLLLAAWAASTLAWAGPRDSGTGRETLAAFFPGAGASPPASEAGLNHFFDRTGGLPSLKTPEKTPEPRSATPRFFGSSPLKPAGLSSAKTPGPKPKYQKLVERMLKRSETARYDSLILRYAERYQLGPGLLKAVIAAESEFKSQAKSRAGALGLMQLMPATAEGMGVPRQSLLDPEANIKAGASYLASLFKILYRRNAMKGSFASAPRWIVRRAIASYNGGLRFLRNRPLYRETRGYLAKVLYFWSSELSRLKLQGGPALLASRY